MPVDRSQYLIELKTSADTAGVEKTLASAEQAREAFQLLRDGAADALGPIGELIQILENPYLLAVAGATLATRTLVEQLEAARENAAGRIEQSTESPDGAGHAESRSETRAPGVSVEESQAAPEARETSQVSSAEAQSRGPDKETDRRARLSRSLQLTRSGAAESESAETTAGATDADVRGTTSRTEPRARAIATPERDRARGQASPEEIAKLIELNDALIGMEENQTAQQGALLEKIDSMMSRVQALEAAQRNTRWQAQ